ncbi:hypothetical protein [Aeoliella sp. SH292]|uniref:hypothetical protein n=1 Tax=Aeoliella sp. SH292 TaxID=3454464 RepID=UPI003F966942
MRSLLARSGRLALPILMVTLLATAPRALAADMRDHAESLKAVPADAAFYAAWLNGEEQWKSITQTNAWKKLISIPVVQMGWMQVETQWQFPTQPELVQFKKWFDSEEGKDVFALAKEMVAQEYFVCGDGSVTTLMEVAMQMNSEINRTPFEALQKYGNPEAIDENEVIKENIVKLLEKYQDKLDVPNITMGFRIKDKARAIRVLDTAEAHLRKQLENEDVPAWVNDQLERKQVSGHEMLTLTVTGDELPWGEIEEEMADTPELFESVKEILEDKEMILVVGLIDDFLVFGVTSTLDTFEDIGEGKLLADSKEFKRLNAHADEDVITLSYVSGAFMEAANSQERSFGDLAVMGKGLLSMGDLTEEETETIEKDIDQLIVEVKALLPTPGAIASATFATERGYEAFTYNYGTMSPSADGTKPLPLINHLGEDSLGWFVARGTQSVEDYDQFVDWCKRAFGHWETIGKRKSSEEDWAKYVEVRDIVVPLLARIDKANRDHLLPGFADGQSAIVFDATMTDSLWFDQMPLSETPLPMPTIAIAMGVSDAGAVRDGAVEYFDVIQAAINEAHEADPEGVPALELEAPKESTTSAGTIYSYELPAEWGVNDRIAPCAGLSDSVLILSTLPELSEKLMAGSKPEVDGPAADFDKPLLWAAHFRCAAMFETLKPWADYGIKVAIEQGDEEAQNAVAAIGFVKPQVDQLIEVLQCLHSITATTYRDGDAWVTHSETRIIDLED